MKIKKVSEFLNENQGIEVDDIKVDIEELKENKNDKRTKFNN